MRQRVCCSALLSAFSLLIAGSAKAQPAQDFIFLPPPSTINTAGDTKLGTIIGYQGLNDAIFQSPDTNNDLYVLGFAIQGPQDTVFKDPVAATLNVVDPADVFSSYIFVYNQSTLNMSGGRIRGEVHSYDSTINLSGTSSLDKFLIAFGGAVNVDGGTIGDPLAAIDSGTGVLTAQRASVQMKKGFVGTLMLSGQSSTDNISGGTLNSVQATAGAFVLIENGLVRGDVSVDGDTTFVGVNGGQINGGIVSTGGTAIVNGGNVSGSLLAAGGNITLGGGTVGGNVAVSSNGQANMTGGNVKGGAYSYGGVMTITSGTVGLDVVANAQSSTIATINISGGIVQGGVAAQSNSMVSVSGDVDILGDLFAASTGEITMDGGTVAGRVTTSGLAEVFLVGGVVNQDVLVQKSSKVFVLGNSHVEGNISADGNSRVSVTGGQVVGRIDVAGSTSLSINSGSTGAASTFGSSFLSMTGGSVFGDASAFDSSSMDLAGGVISGNLDAYNNTLVVVEGTDVLGSITAHDHAALLLLIPLPSSPGGGASHALPGGVVETNLTRGRPALAKLLGRCGVLQADTDPTSPLQIFLYDDSTLEIDGFNFSTALLDPNNNNMFSEYQLSGYFADGSPFGGGLGIQLFVQNGTAASFELVEVPHVPEPTTSRLMLIVGVLAMCSRRRAIVSFTRA